RSSTAPVTVGPSPNEEVTAGSSRANAGRAGRDHAYVVSAAAARRRRRGWRRARRLRLPLPHTRPRVAVVGGGAERRDRVDVPRGRSRRPLAASREPYREPDAARRIRAPRPQARVPWLLRPLHRRL